MHWLFGRREAGPEAAAALRERASHLSARGDHQGAAVALAKLAVLEPANGMHLVRLADAYRRLGRRERAAAVQVRAAEAFAGERRFDRAAACCRAALALYPDHLAAITMLDRLAALRKRQAGTDERERNLHPPAVVALPPPEPETAFAARPNPEEWTFADEETLAEAGELTLETASETAARLSGLEPLAEPT